MKKSFILLILALNAVVAFSQWQRINNPYGGVINTLAFDPATNYLYSGFTSADNTGYGISMSTNNGGSWAPVNTGLPSDLYVKCIAISGSNIFAGTYGNGVFLSTNNGGSWGAVNAGLSNKYVRCIAISGANIFAGVDNGGVCISNNNGGSWTTVNSGILYNTVNCISISGGNIFAGTSSGGVFLSTDNGKTWTAINTGLMDYHVNSLAISGGNIFAGTELGGIFMSTNNGVSWTQLNTGLPSTPAVRCIAVCGGNIFVGTGDIFEGKGIGGIFMSTNNGSSWAPVNTGLPSNTSVRSMAIFQTNILLSSNAGLFFRQLSEITGILDNTLNQSNRSLFYPNPCYGKFKISNNKMLENNTDLEIYNLAGDKIYKLSNLKHQLSREIDISHFPKGTYMIKIYAGKEIYNGKIINQ
jgi:photosystem II stability/assembly factor-like uncharacterized protein